jgi:hypothetical protein
MEADYKKKISLHSCQILTDKYRKVGWNIPTLIKGFVPLAEINETQNENYN